MDQNTAVAKVWAKLFTKDIATYLNTNGQSCLQNLHTNVCLFGCYYCPSVLDAVGWVI